MANNKKIDTPVLMDAYPKVLIDRGFAAESSRRNIEVIIWYKRLINVTLGLLAATFLFSVISVLFAYVQPLPELYGSALDGGLRQIQYVRKPQDPALATLRSGLSSEAVSRRELGAKTSVKLAPQSVAPIAAVGPTGESSSAASAPVPVGQTSASVPSK
jgi:hypothetical protein